MKRFVIINIIAALLAGCGALPDLSSLLAPTTVANAPAPTSTPFALPATFTPDLFVINTAEPTTAAGTAAPLIPSAKPPTATPSVRPTITLEPVDITLFTPSPQLFGYTRLSTNQLIWGYNCDGDRSIKFTVNAVPTTGLKYVLLYARLQDKYSARRSDWGLGAMMNDNDLGTYFYTLYVDQIANYEEYEDAWLQYQFVGSTAGLRVLGRSVVSRNEISLTSCRAINR
ncbi:MAG: hypothetical protein HS124_07495 [Anaerolineales bacterium]|nr:hypothetical protein [Anaerolineales bacterium]MCL4260132.1 hypothetical protein [Anaerolineales bacterium]